MLRSFNVNDLENIFKGLSDPDLIKYYGISYQTLESAKEQMLFFENLETARTGKWWAICSLDNKMFFGAGVDKPKPITPSHQKYFSGNNMFINKSTRIKDW